MRRKTDAGSEAGSIGWDRLENGSTRSVAELAPLPAPISLTSSKPLKSLGSALCTFRGCAWKLDCEPLQGRNPMTLRISSVLLALFAGCTARAGFIQFNDVITSGHGTYYYPPSTQAFNVTVQGPTMGYTLSTGYQSPFYGAGVGGDTPYCCSGQGGFVAQGLSLGCGAYPGSPNCVAEMSINLLGIPTVTGFSGNLEVESQAFTASLNLSGCNGPGCPTNNCYAAGTNCFNANFLGGGTATLTLYPTPTPGVYGNYEAVFDFVAIPEPSSIILAALGLAGIAFARRALACG